MPLNWKRLTQAERRQTRVGHNSPTMIRVGALVGRGEKTLWTVAETAALWAIKPAAEEIQILEIFYGAEIDKDDDRPPADVISERAGKASAAGVLPSRMSKKSDSPRVVVGPDGKEYWFLPGGRLKPVEELPRPEMFPEMLQIKNSARGRTGR
jgi:hypothetical protein